MMSLEEALFPLETKPKTNEQTLTLKQQTIQDLTDKMLQLIQEGRTNFSEISKQLGVSRTTAYEYWHKWKETDEAAYVDHTWLMLLNRVMQDDPVKALECLTRVKVRMLTVKLEVKEEITENKTLTLNMNYSEADKNAILDAYRRLNTNNGSTLKPQSLH